MKRRAIWGAVILTLAIATVFLLIRCGYIQNDLHVTGEDEEWDQPGQSSIHWV